MKALADPLREIAGMFGRRLGTVAATALVAHGVSEENMQELVMAFGVILGVLVDWGVYHATQAMRR